MALDWDWIVQDDDTEIRVQTRGNVDGDMGFDIVDAGTESDSVWCLNAESVTWLRDCLNEWLALRGGS